MTGKVVGQSLSRIDARDKVAGQARYPGDFSIPGMLQAKVSGVSTPTPGCGRLTPPKPRPTPAW